QVDGGHAHEVPGAGEEPGAVHDPAAHLVLTGAVDDTVLHDRSLGSGAAHVEGDELVEADLAGQRLRTHHTGRRPRFDDVHRLGDGRRVGHETAVGLHDEQWGAHVDA